MAVERHPCSILWPVLVCRAYYTYAWSLDSAEEAVEEFVQQRVGSAAGPTFTRVDVVDVGCPFRVPVVPGLSCMAFCMYMRQISRQEYVTGDCVT